MQIGILALQDDFLKHQRILALCEAEAILINKPEEMISIDGLIISGSEINTIGNLIERNNLSPFILKKVEQGMPVFGICAGMLILAKETEDKQQFSLNLMDIKALGNLDEIQPEHFQVDLVIDALGKVAFPGVFVGRPYVEFVKPNVGILAVHEGRIVMVRQGNFLGTAFHPQFTNDLRVHLYFKQMIEDAKV